MKLMFLGFCMVAFVVAVVVFFQIRSEAPAAQFHDLTYYRWVDAGTFHLTFGFLIDDLPLRPVLS